MSEILTKSRARNSFYGGSLLFITGFIFLTFHSHRCAVDVSTAGMMMSPEVILGGHVWKRHSCINCLTLHGKGAYFAPEPDNVMTRRGVTGDLRAAYETLGGWIAAQPGGIEGRRQISCRSTSSGRSIPMRGSSGCCPGYLVRPVFRCQSNRSVKSGWSTRPVCN